LNIWYIWGGEDGASRSDPLYAFSFPSNVFGDGIPLHNMTSSSGVWYNFSTAARPLGRHYAACWLQQNLFNGTASVFYDVLYFFGGIEAAFARGDLWRLPTVLPLTWEQLDGTDGGTYMGSDAHPSKRQESIGGGYKNLMFFFGGFDGDVGNGLLLDLWMYNVLDDPGTSGFDGWYDISLFFMDS